MHNLQEVLISGRAIAALKPCEGTLLSPPIGTFRRHHYIYPGLRRTDRFHIWAFNAKYYRHDKTKEKHLSQGGLPETVAFEKAHFSCQKC